MLRTATAEDAAMYEKLIADRPELAATVNLSLPGATADAASVKGNRRLGLAWMTGLARVEVGTMLAAFSDIRRPFDVLPPSAYDASAFREILLDGARVHSHQLVNDGLVEKAVEQGLSRGGIALFSAIRHLILTRAMLGETAQRWAGDLPQEQAKEIVDWKRQLDDVQGSLSSFVQIGMQPQYSQQTSTSQRDTIRTCQQLNRAELREQEAGTLKIEFFE